MVNSSEYYFHKEKDKDGGKKAKLDNIDKYDIPKPTETPIKKERHFWDKEKDKEKDKDKEVDKHAKYPPKPSHFDEKWHLQPATTTDAVSKKYSGDKEKYLGKSDYKK